MREEDKMKYKIKMKKGDIPMLIENVVYVPSTNKNQVILNQKLINKRVNEVRRYLSKKYGGYTSISGVGGWLKGKKLIVEPVIQVHSFSTKTSKNLVKQIRTWGKKWGQDEMAYELEGDLYRLKIEKKLNKKRRR
jgi:hypothetical protein